MHFCQNILHSILSQSHHVSYAFYKNIVFRNINISVGKGPKLCGLSVSVHFSGLSIWHVITESGI